MTGGEVLTQRYLLRLWMVGGDGPAWRASLEDPRTAERHGFGSLDALFAFLRAETRDLGAMATAEEEDEEGRAPAADRSQSPPPNQSSDGVS